MGEYHQVLRTLIYLLTFWLYRGIQPNKYYKKTWSKITFFFSKFIKNFEGKNNSNNELEINIQDVSNDKYLKLYKIESNLVDYNQDVLENSIDFTHNSDNLFLGVKSSVYERLNTSNNDKYEYIFPDAFLNKNLFVNDLGSLDLQSNLKIRNYDTNKETKFLTNSFDWKSSDIQFDTGFSSKILGKIKNINYEADNVDIYKNDFTSEVKGAIGLLSDLKLKKENGNSKQFLTPKFLIKYAPGSMRKDTGGSILNPSKAFSINKADDANNFETGLSGTIGFDYKIKKGNKNQF